MVEIKMAENNEKQVNMAPTCMESVNRIVKLPVVESSIQTATNVYGKVKDMNGYAKWGFETMESTLNSVVETGKPYAMPVVHKFDGPIKKVDSVLCTGLDYVEAKVPAMKLPPNEIFRQLYTSTKDFVHDNVTPKVDAAYKTVHGVVDPAVQAAMKAADPAVQAAKKVADPAVNLAKPTVEAAYKMVEPTVQQAVDKAHALKDYGVQKVEEFLHRESRPEDEKQVVRSSRPLMSILRACSVVFYNFNIYSDAEFPYVHFFFNFQFMMLENYELSQ